MIPTAKRLEAFPEYVFAKMNRLIKEVEQASNRKVINLGIGSPDFPPSTLYLEKYAEFIKDQKAHMYPGYAANQAFSDALVSWYKKRFGVSLTTDQLLPLIGAKDATSHLPLAVADSGDEILVPNPGYPGFAGPLLLFGITPIYYDLHKEKQFRLDLQEIERKITKKTKAIWINFPSNPTGQIATVQELQPLVALAKRKHILIIYDNAYSEITFNNFIAPSILQLEEAKDIAVELGSFSKSFSFAGYRIGWIVGNTKIIEALAKVKSQIDSGLSTPLQNLGAFALTHPDNTWHKEMIESYQTRRDKIAEKLTTLGLTFALPHGGLYIWAQIPDNQPDSEEYAVKLLKEKQVFMAPGIAFGDNGKRYVRVSICADITNIDSYL